MRAKGRGTFPPNGLATLEIGISSEPLHNAHSKTCDKADIPSCSQ